MTYQSPATTDFKHLRNQSFSPVNTIPSTRVCFGPNCNGRRRSIAQFYDKPGNPTRKLCKLCRCGRSK